MNRKHIFAVFLLVSVIGAFFIGAKTGWFGVSGNYRCNSPRVFVSPDPCVGKEVEIIGWVGWLSPRYVQIMAYEWMEMSSEVQPPILFDRSSLSGIVADQDSYLGDYVRVKGTLGYEEDSRNEIFVISNINTIGTYESYRETSDELLNDPSFDR